VALVGHASRKMDLADDISYLLSGLLSKPLLACHPAKRIKTGLSNRLVGQSTDRLAHRLVYRLINRSIDELTKVFIGQSTGRSADQSTTQSTGPASAIYWSNVPGAWPVTCPGKLGYSGLDRAAER
jgi:hypothetical protein